MINENIYNDIKKLIEYSTEINNLYSDICSYYPFDESYEDCMDNLDNLLDLIGELKDEIKEEDLYYKYILNKLSNREYYIQFYNAFEYFKKQTDKKYFTIFNRISNYLNYFKSKKNKDSYLDYVLNNDLNNLFIYYLINYDEYQNIKLSRFTKIFENKILEKKYLANDFDNDLIILEYKYVLNDVNYKKMYEDNLQEKVIDYCKSLFIKYLEEKDNDKKIVYLCSLQSRLILLDNVSIEIFMVEINDLYEKNLINIFELNFIKGVVNQSREDLEDIYYLDEIKKRK